MSILSLYCDIHPHTPYHSTVDPLMCMFEFIESPLQKVKRAGLGLLSRGLGRCVFCVCVDVRCVSMCVV